MATEIHDFTDQELEVILAVSKGLPSKEIAQECGLAVEVVAKLIYGTICEKVGVSNRMELMLFAIKNEAALNAELRRRRTGN